MAVSKEARGPILIVVGLVVLALAYSSVFTVNERELAVVLEFGKPIKSIDQPGLNFKIPFIQEVVRYDGRILSLDTPEIEITPSDDRRLVVDAFARYRIGDTEEKVFHFNPRAFGPCCRRWTFNRAI